MEIVLHESLAGNLSQKFHRKNSFFLGLAPEDSFNKAQADMLSDVIADLEVKLTAVGTETDQDKKVSQGWKS